MMKFKGRKFNLECFAVLCGQRITILNNHGKNFYDPWPEKTNEQLLYFFYPLTLLYLHVST